jgi:lipopolysaccharide/colanic/teichoic acid biosynthesis glycosyltransferase
LLLGVGWVNSILPEEKPRHLLGIGDPLDLFDAVEEGCDLFDCVAPTRIARHGTLYSPNGLVHVMNSSFRNDMSGVIDGCKCYTCTNFSKAYLGYLFRAREFLAYTLASIHNLYFIVNLVKGMRKAIIDASKMYESIFDRIPLSMVGERWLIENSGTALGNRRVYDLFKRLMDIGLATLLGVISLIFYPLVYISMRLDDKGPLLITQERIGKNGKHIRMAKFRSMTSNDGGVYAGNGGRTKLRITRLGAFIRLTRIDELPQLWSVIRGDQSLIGPRPELPALVAIYEKEIPYYNVLYPQGYIFALFHQDLHIPFVHIF